MRKLLLLGAAVLLTVGSAAAIEFNNPVDSTSTNFGSFSSAQNLTFQGRVSDSFGSGDLNVYEKDPLDTSFSESSKVEGVNIDDWPDKSELPLGPKTGDLATLLTGDSSTVSICGEEHTFELHGFTDSDIANVSIDGSSGFYQEGESVAFSGIDCDNGGQVYALFNSVQQDAGGIGIDSYRGSYYHGDGYHEYRLKWEPTGKDGDIISFSVNKNGNNLPRLANSGISVDGKSLSAGSTATNITPNSTIEFTVDDPNGDGISDPKVYNADGSLIKSYNLGVSDGGTFELKTQDREFLSNESKSYGFYVQLTDNEDPQQSRNTLETTLDTGTGDNSVINTSLNTLECKNADEPASNWTSCTDVEYGDLLSQMRTCGEWNKVQFSYINFSITEEYDAPVQGQLMKDETYSSVDNTENCFYYDFNLSSQPWSDVSDSGDWNASAEIKQSNGHTDKINKSWRIPFGNLTLTDYRLCNASSSCTVVKNNEFNMSGTVACVNGECASETNSTHNVTENVSAYADPVEVNQGSKPREEEISALEQFLSWLLGGLTA